MFIYRLPLLRRLTRSSIRKYLNSTAIFLHPLRKTWRFLTLLESKRQSIGNRIGSIICNFLSIVGYSGFAFLHNKQQDKDNINDIELKDKD